MSQKLYGGDLLICNIQYNMCGVQLVNVFLFLFCLTVFYFTAAQDVSPCTYIFAHLRGVKLRCSLKVINKIITRRSIKARNEEFVLIGMMCASYAATNMSTNTVF